uniref:Translation initiation factor IF-2, chloroplastic n=1 Tax=Kuetzingia canaliculata TaxID=228262 RepID=A0A1Z1MQ54_KUECA|nr:translation initiation factor 2 [Kuetzingia canaliculata]ARW67874.1 translation initiation factor 2 [Kuetzingia canaliculata]
MIYISLKNFTVLKVCSISQYSLFYPYSDNILELILPKLIDSKYQASNSKFDLVKITPEIMPSSFNIDGKTDKKYKNNTHSQNFVDAKKNKGKLSKKKRKNADIVNNEDIFTPKQDHFLMDDQDNLNISLLKSRKSKKKDKELSGAIHSNNQTFEENTLNHLDKKVFIDCALTVEELSVKLKMHVAEIITYLFINKSISITINQLLDISIAKEVASNYGFHVLHSNVNNQRQYSASQEHLISSNNIKRSPIITILGHVDHGKTTLLDAILNANLVQKEPGGITQAISVHEVEYLYNSIAHNLVFLDTPGHKSFKSMRIRGAQVTDIALLVVAVDDGLQPQTIEAINYIIQMDLTCIVVITKIDKLSSNLDRIQQDLANYGLLSEVLGGNTPFVHVSAITGLNIDELLSKICIISDLKNFVADADSLADGIILEAYLDKKQGPISNLVIKNGTLKLGDIVVSGNTYGKVKSIQNSSGKKVNFSRPSSIVQVLGFSVTPQAGNHFKVFNSEKEAKKYALSISHVNIFHDTLKSLNMRVALADNNLVKQFRLIIKADTQGSLEAIIDLLSQVSQLKVQINIISANFGSISNNDIELAIATDSVIVSFNISITSQINALLKKSNILFKNFDVIYDLFEYVKTSMLDLIDPEYEKKFIGRAIVQAVFRMNKGIVAGCLVEEGKIKKSCYIHVIRNKQLVYEGLLISLKRTKNDVDEVIAINECGLMADYDLWENTDIIEAYELISQEKIL